MWSGGFQTARGSSILFLSIKRPLALTPHIRKGRGGLGLHPSMAITSLVQGLTCLAAWPAKIKGLIDVRGQADELPGAGSGNSWPRLRVSFRAAYGTSLLPATCRRSTVPRSIMLRATPSLRPPPNRLSPYLLAVNWTDAATPSGLSAAAQLCRELCLCSTCCNGRSILSAASEATCALPPR